MNKFIFKKKKLSKNLHTYIETKHHQEPISSRGRHTMQILQQHRNRARSFNILVAQTANHRHLKPHYWTLHCPPGRRDAAPPTGTLTQASLIGKLDKPLVQPQPQGGTPTIKRNHKLPERERPSQTQQQQQQNI